MHAMSLSMQDMDINTIIRKKINPKNAIFAKNLNCDGVCVNNFVT